MGGVSSMRAVVTPPRTLNPAAPIAGQENEAPIIADDVLEWHTARLGELQDAYYNSPKAPLEAESAGQGTHAIDVEEPWSVTDNGTGSTSSAVDKPAALFGLPLLCCGAKI